MLRKLLKYEAYATARIFVPLYSLLILFALINKAFIAINSDNLKIPSAIAMTVFVVIIIAICVMTLVVTIQRFYKNLLSDEGYLMFTLPVHAHSHITSKLLISMLWCILSIIVSLFAVLLMAANPQNMAEFSRGMAEAINDINRVGLPAYVLIAEFIIAALLSTAVGIVTIYAAMAVGNFSGKHRVLVSLAAYIGFGVIEQIVASIILFAMPKDWEINFDHITWENYMPALNTMQAIFLGMIIFTLFFGVLYYWFTNFILKKKLNLE